MSIFSPEQLTKWAQEVTINKAIDITDLHVPTLESSWSLAYRQDPGDFITDLWFPKLGVNQPSGKYMKWSKGNFLTPKGGAWKPGTGLPSVELSTDDMGEFACTRYALETPLPQDLPEVQDKGVNVEMATSYLITDALQLRKEVQTAASFFTSGIWGFDWTGVSSAETGTSGMTTSLTFRQLNDYFNSDPLQVFKDARMMVKKTTAKTPNTVVMGEQVYEALRIHPQLTNLFRNPQGAQSVPTKLNEQMLAQALDMDKILIGKAMYNTAADNVTPALDWIFGKKLWIGYVDTPGLMKQTAGLNLSFDSALGGFDTAVRQVPDLRTAATFYQGFQYYAQKIPNNYLGVMLSTAIA